jgi:hypothetical protein
MAALVVLPPVPAPAWLSLLPPAATALLMRATLVALDSFGAAAAATTIAVTVNGAPVITAPATATVGKSTATAISGVSLAETGNTAGETFTVKLTDTHGLLAASGTGITGSGTNALTLTGTLAQVNADLATLTDTDATTPSDKIKLTATDSFGNSAAAKTIAVTVSNTPAAVTSNHFAAANLNATDHGGVAVNAPTATDQPMKLVAGSNLMLGAMHFATAEAAVKGHAIATLVRHGMPSEGAGHILTGAAAFSGLFNRPDAVLGSDMIRNFAGSDQIDLRNTLASKATGLNWRPDSGGDVLSITNTLKDFALHHIGA